MRNRLSKKDDIETIFLIDEELRDELYEKWDMIVVESNQFKNQTLQIKNTFSTIKAWASDNSNVLIGKSYGGNRNITTHNSTNDTGRQERNLTNIIKTLTNCDVHCKPVPLNIKKMNNPYLSY